MDRDWLADIDDFVDGENRTVHLLPESLARQRYHQPFFRQERFYVGETVDRDDTGRRFGDVGIETSYDGVTMAAAEKTSMQRARQQDVVNKLARPHEHWSVFEAQNRFADHHDLPLKRRSLACGRIRESSCPAWANDLAILWELATRAM